MDDALLDDRGRHYAIVARAIEFIRGSALRQPSLAEIANAVHLSEFHLQRVFAAWAGISPKRFLQFLTKEYAKQALRKSADVLSVAVASGLSGPGRLHDLMVTCEAMTPGEIRRRGAGVPITHGLAPTPFGEALLAWTPRGLCYMAFCDDDASSRLVELAEQWPEATLTSDPAAARRYVARIFPDPSPPDAPPPQLHLVLRGSNFQIKVWEALLDVKTSRIVSYSQLAARAGVPKAQRAVGSALAANTLAYLIPCHRVIRETGDAGIYRWGSERKSAMLAWEAALDAA